jgi:glutamate synthase (NADPH/NADH) small chain
MAATLEFVGRNGVLTGVKCIRVDDKRQPIEGTEFIMKADLAFIAIGFGSPLLDTFIAQLEPELKTSRRGDVSIDANEMDYRTSVDGLYAAGDCRRGQSLVVWAIREGRQAARAIDMKLMGKTDLPR